MESNQPSVSPGLYSVFSTCTLNSKFVPLNILLNIIFLTIRATVPIMTEDNLQAKFFLLLSFDIGTDVRAIIENELLPYIDKNLRLFK